jgi:23S rRNA pseudouridine1911/1915/1917 synthase
MHPRSASLRQTGPLRLLGEEEIVEMQPEHVVHGVTGTTRLVDYLKDRLILVPVTEVGDLITSGLVRIDLPGGSVTGRTIDLVADGDRIAIDGPALAALEAASRWNPSWDHPVTIHHEDDDVLVVEKPAGMHVHPLSFRREHTLVNALVFHAGAREGRPWGNWRPHTVQRLDGVVSGLLVVAKSAAAKATLVRAQQQRELSRGYLAMVAGRVSTEGGIIDAAVGRDPAQVGRRCVLAVEQGGRRAITLWKVRSRFDDRTLVELNPETGRTHQLRVHMASLGHPILGDLLYDAPPLDPDAAGIALHATEVSLRHPRSGELLVVRSAPPAGFGLYDSTASGDASP